MRIHLVTALAMVIAGVPLAMAQQPPASLTIEAAIAQALETGPRTAAAQARRQAAAAGVDQADVAPNPQLSVEMENFKGSGPYRDFRSSERTYSLSQTLELGGKRGARVDAARAGLSRAGYDLEISRLDLTRDVRLAFAEALAAEADLALADDQVRLAGEVERAIQARLDAGREAPIQLSRAEIARRQAQMVLDQAKRRAQLARQMLAGLTGIPQTGQHLVDDWFTRLDSAPAVQTGESADLLRQQTAVRQGRADLAVERAKAIPDVTVSAGFRQFREGDNNAFLVGVSVPIPVFDQNRGAIARARAELTAAEADLAAERIDRDRRLAAAQANLDAARDGATALKDQIIPTAETAFAAAQEGYRQGKFAYLEVLEAQRTLFEARRDLINTLQGFHNARAELDRLTATAAVTGAEGAR
ncbi:TolC family protein [Niveispirillum sp. BGYR6]|uniref:TolC family protein n=1 Tax=Niveispirillum sp. BGYR6 TaxID=2971249 RepID=UPI0022B95A3B|nr:TolC family protein [Niveispirillum sp. BGYR6]MDG5496426.1 TolC family protein [Niveispirillum sp. BGYR6]